MPNTNYQQLSDEQLVELIKQGQTELFEILYEKYIRLVTYLIQQKFWIYSIRKGQAGKKMERSIEDIISEIMIRVFSRLDHFDQKKGTFKAWVLSILDHYVIDLLKEKQLPIWEPSCEETEEYESAVSKIEETIPSNEPSPFQKALLKEIINIVLKTIEDMPNQNLKIFLISKFIFLLSDKEISEMLNISEAGVRSNVCNALKMFSKLFSYPEANPETIVDVLREGWLQIEEKQIEKIENSKAKKVITLRTINKYSIEEICKELELKEKEVYDLLKTAIFELSKKGLKRKMETPEETKKELTQEEIQSISDHISLLITGQLDEKKITRKETDSPEVQNLKTIATLLAISTASLRQKLPHLKPIGNLILEESKKRNMSLDELAKNLDLNIHELSAILNNKIEDKLKSNKNFVSKLAEFLNLSQHEILFLFEISRPPISTGKSRHFKLESEFHLKLKQKISRILTEKYKQSQE